MGTAPHPSTQDEAVTYVYPAICVTLIKGKASAIGPG
jgi:hypothetical protein